MTPNPLTKAGRVKIRTISAEIAIPHMTGLPSGHILGYAADLLGGPLIVTSISRDTLIARPASTGDGPLTQVAIHRDTVTGQPVMVVTVDNRFVPHPPIGPKKFCESKGAGGYGEFSDDARILLAKLFPEAKFLELTLQDKDWGELF